MAAKLSAVRKTFYVLVAATALVLLFTSVSDVLRRFLVSSPPALKTILLWNSAHRIEAASFGVGHEAFVRNECPVSDCRIVTNASDYSMESYDAIVVNMHELWLSQLPDFQRRPNQRLIFFTQESPQVKQLNISD